MKAMQFVVFAFLQFCAAAQQPEAPKHLILPAGSYEIADVVRRFATYLDLNILFQESELRVGRRATVSIEFASPLNTGRDDALGVLSNLLYIHNLVVVPLDRKQGLFDIINMDGARRGEVQSRAIWVDVTRVEEWADTKVSIRTVMTLAHIDAQFASTSLRPFFLQSGQVGSLAIGSAGSGNSVMLQGFGSQVADAVDLIRAMDTPRAARKENRALVARVAELEKRVAELEKELATLKK